MDTNRDDYAKNKVNAIVGMLKGGLDLEVRSTPPFPKEKRDMTINQKGKPTCTIIWYLLPDLLSP